MSNNLVSAADALTMKQILLPKPNYCPLEHLQAVFAEEKWTITKSHCSLMKVPPWPELGVKNMWPTLKAIPNVEKYLPDSWLQNGLKRCDRKFLWQVVGFLDPVFVNVLIKDCTVQRDAREEEQYEDLDDQPITNKWKAELAKVPYAASK